MTSGAAGMVGILLKLRSAGAAVLPHLGKGGWAESKFVDTTIERMHADFLEMYTKTGFTDRKLRLRIGDHVEVPRDLV